MSYSTQTLTVFSDILGKLYAAETPEAALHSILPGLSTLLGARQIFVDELPDDGKPPTPLGGLHLEDWGDAILRYPDFVHEHPAVQFVRAGGFAPVYRIRDFGSSQAFEKTGFYCEIFRPAGVRDQLCVAAKLKRSGVAITFHRDTLFSDEEAQLAALLQPHVAAAVQGRRRLIGIIGESLASKITISADGEAVAIPPAWVELFGRYFQPQPIASGRLPDELCRWVRTQIARWRVLGPNSPALPGWTVIRPAGRLHLQLSVVDLGEGYCLRAREERGAFDFFLLQAHGLTLRECEVAFWVAQGKRDAEIALVLDCATKTVSKHVENILVKTGAETRLGAARVLAEWQHGID